MPKDAWSREEAAPVVESIISWGKMVVTPNVDKYLNEKTTTAAANSASPISK